MADLDILDEGEAKAAVRITSDSLLGDLIAMASGISAQIDDLCGPVVAREAVETFSGGHSRLMFSKTPVLSIDEVVETTGITPATLTVNTDYQLVNDGLHNDYLFRRSAGYDSFWITGTRNVVVTLQRGRYLTTEDVEPKWKQVAASILRYQWQQEAGAWTRSPSAYDDFDNGGEPPFLSVEDMVRRRLARELLPPGIA